MYTPQTVHWSELEDRDRLCCLNSLIWTIPWLSQLTATTNKWWGWRKDMKVKVWKGKKKLKRGREGNMILLKN